MRKLGLLLSTLSLAACASTAPQDGGKMSTDEVGQAEIACASQSVDPTDSHYLPCLNRFTIPNYGMVVRRSGDGSLTTEDVQTFLYQYAALVGCKKLRATSSPHERADVTVVTGPDLAYGLPRKFICPL